MGPGIATFPAPCQTPIEEAFGMAKPITYCAVLVDGAPCGRRNHSDGMCTLHFQRAKRGARLDGRRFCPCGEEVRSATGPACCSRCRPKNQRRSEYSWALQRLYGITPTEYAALLAQQDGRCMICGSTDPGGRRQRFSVDHDHQSGTIRGLLCHKCNVGLGMFNDNPELLRTAASYLEV